MKRWLGLPILLLSIVALTLNCGGGGGDSPSPGQSSQPPTATTDPATSITATTANLHCTIHASGTQTTFFFELGTDPNLVNSTKYPALFAFENMYTYGILVENLSPSTKYYFRVVAGNSVGTVYGNILNFTTATLNAPPTVQTQAATSITQIAATINASVNPNGLATTAHFEWATDNVFISVARTPDQAVGSGATSVAINAPLSALAPATYYYYRVVATNSAGTSTGATSSFRTIAPNTPPAVQTLNATAIAQSSATLNGSVNGYGLNTTIYFLWGTDNTLASRTPDQSVGSPSGNIQRSASISGLAPSTTYYFQIVAINTMGFSKGSIVSFTTLPSSTTPTVQTVAYTLLTSTSVTLNASINPNGSETRFFFEWGTTVLEPMPYRTPDQIVGSGTTSVNVSATLSGLTPGTTYYYRIFAFNAVGASPGSILTFKTSASIGTLPLVTIGGADSITATSMRFVSGSVVSSDSPAVAFYEYWTDPSFVGALRTPNEAVSGFASITATATNLTPSTYYYFRLGATNAAGTAYSGTVYGQFGIGNVQTITPADWPLASTTLIITFSPTSAVLEGGVISSSLPATVHFEYDTDVNFANALRTPDQAIPPTSGEPSGMKLVNATVTSLSPATSYYYRVVATNANGTSMGHILIFVTNP